MHRDPIAIVGIGCRFPGDVNSPADFWRMLIEGREAIGEVPVSRWSLASHYSANFNAPGKMHTRFGGFVNNPDYFDAGFFGISPREAKRIDPQQRWLLETAFEALEDAGQPAGEIAGRPVSVFVGISSNDYAALQTPGRSLVDLHTNSGSALSIAANRISYQFDLRGPSAAVDTACSSSLTAIHLACMSIWQGEASMALAGGVNALLRPELTIGFSKAGMLSPSGRCYPFDSRADGYVRAEGAGMVLLKPLSRALADGDAPYAIIRTTAINQDGHTGSMTVPSEEAQIAMMLGACDAAGIPPQNVSFIEAHGTGTPVGDPIEARALGAVFGRGRPADQPCWLGSVKANIGHLESAAGIAGLIKTALVLKNRSVPPNLNFSSPNPRIDFAKLRLQVPVKNEALDPGRSLFACVNSFGFGGSNAHLLLESAPEREFADSRSAGPYILPLSARSESALAAYSEQVCALLEEPGTQVSDLCYSAAARRTHHAVRRCITGENVGELIEGLRSAIPLHAEAEPEVRPIFVFTGQGPQWWGMGRELCGIPEFADSIAEFDGHFSRFSGWSIWDVFRGEPSTSRMSDTAAAQPALAALQIGLHSLFSSWGINPSAVIGHSVGEVAAAVVSGLCTLEEAARVVYHRSRLQQLTHGGGGMLALGVNPESANDLIDELAGELELAAINGPEVVTIAGPAAAIDRLRRLCEERTIFVKSLGVDYAFHSRQMEGIKHELLDSLADLAPAHTPKIPFYSTVTGEPLAAGEYGAYYWWRNVREPVLFHRAVESAASRHRPVFLEIGPHPTLSGLLRKLPPLDGGVSGHVYQNGSSHNGSERQVFSTLVRGQPELRALYRSLGGLYSLGASVSWKRVYPPAEYSPMKLPLYSWKRERFWSESRESAASRQDYPVHPFLGYRVSGPKAEWESNISLPEFPFLRDHRIQGSVVFPAAGFLEIFTAAANELGQGTEVSYSSLQFLQALILTENEDTTIRCSAHPGGGSVEIFSRRGTGEWTLHATASLEKFSLAERGRAPAAPRDEPISPDKLYCAFKDGGYHYGPSFRLVTAYWRTAEDEVIGTIDGSAIAQEGMLIHPALLDACLQCLKGTGTETDLFLPVQVARFGFFGRPPKRVQSRVKVTARTGAFIEADFSLFGEDGAQFAAIEGFRCQRIAGAARGKQLPVYVDVWEEIDLEDRPEGAANLDPLSILNLSVDGEVSEVGYAHLVYEIEASHAAPAKLFDLISKLKPFAAGPPPRLWVLSRRNDVSLDASAELQELFGGALRGFMRVLMNEMPRYRPTLIETEGKLSDRAVIELIRANLPEQELSLRGNEWRAARLRTFVPKELKPRTAMYTPGDSKGIVKLSVDPPTSFENLFLAQSTLPPPAAGEITIDVRAAGLNFRDLLKTLSLYPGEGPEMLELGDECAGVVKAVGEGVSKFRVGDEVAGMSPGSFGSKVNLSESLAVSKPTGLSFEEAAALPVAFLTALYALEIAGCLKRGESALIHSAAGGVGLAAVQVAKHLGAEVFATAGSDDKRSYLRALGVRAVFDSRTLDFEREIKRLTGGRGVDVVLNSLAGDFLAASLRLLAPGGRFLELGKRDIYGGTKINLRSLAQNASFRAIDLVTAAREEREVMLSLLARLESRISDGSYFSLPLTVFRASAARDAFRFMGQAKHTGKIVLAFDEGSYPVRPSKSAALFSQEASYLVTGGLGGFGLATARWMAQHGARRLVLMSRSGVASLEALAAVQELRTKGTEIVIEEADVRNYADVQQVVKRISESGFPLRGVFHAAAEIGTGSLQDLTPEHFDSVFTAKAMGALHLHRATLEGTLDYFVLFSSASAVLGGIGQGSYAAANAALDSLAEFRRSRGLPALSVNWGVIGDTGFVTRSEHARRYFAVSGIDSISAAEALAALGEILLKDQPRAGIFACEWQKVARALPAVAQSPRFGDLFTNENGDLLRGEGHGWLMTELSSREASDRRGVLLRYLTAQIANVSGSEAAKIDPRHSLINLGLDSLMVFQLKIQVDQDLGAVLDPTRLLGVANLYELADVLLECAGVAEAARAGDEIESPRAAAL